MKRVALKIARIGNSRGVRLPAATLARYQIGSEVIMEERSDGILLRPTSETGGKLSWEDTAREMAAETEDWSVWDSVSGDGLDTLPWDGKARTRRVAEPETTFKARRRHEKS
jgi:antitoxin component of MazEF toxin-antitoxin module